MGAVLVAKGLAAAHGEHVLFTGLDLVVGPGDVIGLVGVNGAGKSTLLRMLAGLIPARRGTSPLTPPGAPVGYLPQERDRRPAETVRQFVARRTGVAAAQDAMQAAADALAAGTPGAEDAYADGLERWLALGGADLDERAEAVVAELGLAVELDLAMSALSGGQAARAGLASLLLSRYEVVLLDEPTNDLDTRRADPAGGLRRRAAGRDGRGQPRPGVPDPDRDPGGRARSGPAAGRRRSAVVTRLTWPSGRWPGGTPARSTRSTPDTRGPAGSRARTQRAWMDKGVTQRPAQAARQRQVDPRASGSRRRRSRRPRPGRPSGMIERLDVVEEPRKEWQLRMEIAAAPRAGAVVAVLRGAVVRRGAFTLGPVDLQIDWADRVAITGPNGSGKIHAAGRAAGPDHPGRGAPPRSARASWSARSTRPGGCSWATSRCWTRSRRPRPGCCRREARTLLAKFGLRAEHVLRPAATLSPGERTRAALALLQARGVNLLVLDEPTNHLDLPAIEQLEQAL